MRRVSRSCGPYVGLLVINAVLFGGCASAAPSKRTENTAATVRAAEEAGAADVPTAKLHLQLAKEQLEYARRLQQRGDDVSSADAELLLMRAQADADLAVAVAHESKDRVVAQQALDQALAIQQQQ